MRNLRFRGVLAGVVGALIAISSMAASADAVKYRQAVMKSIGGHMGSMGSIAKGEVPHKSHLMVHARALESTMAVAGDAFKTKTSGGKTTALDKVWTDWDGFAEKLKDAEKAANVLVRTLENDGDAGAALKELGKTCGGCHKAYRKKKKM